MGPCLSSSAKDKAPQPIMDESVYDSDNVRRLVISLSSYNAAQSLNLYNRYKGKLDQVGVYGLYQSPPSAHPSLSTIYVGRLKQLATVGYHMGAISALLFEDDLVCLLFEYNNNAYTQSRAALRCWWECDRTVYTLRLAILNLSDQPGDAQCVVRASLCQGRDNKEVSI